MKLRQLMLAGAAALVLSLPTQASAFFFFGEQESIVDVALDVNENVAPGAFDTLLALVVDQPTVLRRLDSRFLRSTVFAPTDEAFEDLAAVVDALYCIELTDLPPWYIRDVLNNHIARGVQDSTDVFGGRNRLRMVFGGFLYPNPADLTLGDNLQSFDELLGTGSIGPTAIVDPFFDVFADNGVIHAVDRVVVPYLLPASFSACP